MLRNSELLSAGLCEILQRKVDVLNENLLYSKQMHIEASHIRAPIYSCIHPLKIDNVLLMQNDDDDAETISPYNCPSSLSSLCTRSHCVSFILGTSRSKAAHYPGMDVKSIRPLRHYSAALVRSESTSYPPVESSRVESSAHCKTNHITAYAIAIECVFGVKSNMRGYCTKQLQLLWRTCEHKQNSCWLALFCCQIEGCDAQKPYGHRRDSSTFLNTPRLLSQSEEVRERE